MSVNTARNTILKLVENSSIQRRNFQFWDPNSKGHTHTLHNLINTNDAIRSEIANYFINEFSNKNEIVLDPFCGAGTVPLEAAVNSRVPYYSDVDPFLLSLASAKLQPADITEVTLFLQQINLKKPISTTHYQQYFSEFYDIDTFKEIVNLKKHLLSTYDNTARFVEVLALSLLHGNNAGYFSTFTNPNFSLSPEEQRDFNIQRKQRPEYRPVTPRLLKKTAFVTSDGITSSHLKVVESSTVKRADARNLNYLKNQSIDLILTSPPLPNSGYNPTSYWLKHWFSDINPSDFANSLTQTADLTEWLDFMNECLMEFARVLNFGKFATLHIRDIYINNKIINLSEDFVRMVKEELAAFWSVEYIYTNDLPNIQLNVLRPRENTSRSLVDRVVVLKRK